VKTLKHLALMATGTGLKMAAGLLALAVLARSLGVDGFGTLMIFLSAAGVLCVLANLGLNTFVLREIAREPARAQVVAADALSARLILAAATGLLALGLALASPRFLDPVFLLLLLTLLAEGFTESFNTGLRATGNFALETRQSLLAALLNSSLIIAAAWVGGTLLVVACAYLLSRALITAVALRSLLRVVGTVRPGSWRDGLRCLRDTVSYSVDAGFSALFGQVDGVVLGAVLPVSVVGIYQGGLRIFMSALTGTGILTQVYLPRATAELAATGGRPAAVSRQVIYAFAAVGLAVGLLMALALPPLVERFYGADFAPLKVLLPWFGLLFALRMVAGAWGVLLTAQGAQRYRSIGMAAHWLLIAAVAMLAVPRWGATGWILALAIGTLGLGLGYAARAWALVDGRPRVLAASLSPLLLLLPLWLQH
jgi:O-antigen/teichoic acid export membrane protein